MIGSTLNKTSKAKKEILIKKQESVLASKSKLDQDRKPSVVTSNGISKILCNST